MEEKEEGVERNRAYGLESHISNSPSHGHRRHSSVGKSHPPQYQDGYSANSDSSTYPPATTAAEETVTGGHANFRHGNADALAIQFRVRVRKVTIKIGAEAECEVKTWKCGGAPSNSGSVGGRSSAYTISIASYEGPISDCGDVEDDAVVRGSHGRRGPCGSGGGGGGWLNMGKGQTIVEYFVRPSEGGEDCDGPTGDPPTVSRTRPALRSERQPDLAHE
ncbi:hypothetical protein HOY80DRAFT_1003437 [Tuber brumale]|nr:hypothetical protein HOY80DRAFT_1003437 [Tuber brumale]